jgi:hypothetical protein
LKSLVDREIEREQAGRTLAAPELIVPGQTARKAFMRRSFDTNLRQEMLLRIILEGTTEEIVQASKVVRNTREIQFAVGE